MSVDRECSRLHYRVDFQGNLEPLGEYQGARPTERQTNGASRMNVDSYHAEKIVKFGLNEAHHEILHNDKLKGKAIKARKEKGLKREGMAKEELMDVLFRMFHGQSEWTTYELVDRLEQPENHLKKTLEEICDFHKKGARQSSWTLKKHFQRNFSQ